MSDMAKNLILWLVIAVVLMSVFQSFGPGESNGRTVDYTTFVQEVGQGQIQEATFKDGEISFVRRGGGAKMVTYMPVYDQKLLDDLINQNVKVQGTPPEEQSLLGTIFISWFPMILLIGVWIFFMRQMQGGGGKGAMSFGKSKARMMSEEQIKTTFADVAGCDEAKEDVKELVDYLRDPSRFQKLGGKIPTGVLMVGPPGTGKTLLAKAIAGEAKVPFFTISGSDFVEMFVGVGASRVRDMFEQAKKAAPCIIFIDEIDAVGRQRGAGVGGGHDEREQTLNQLLVEMDGFESNEGVILIDDKFDRDHDQIVDLVKSVTNQPIKYVISTHYHEDHSGGNIKMFAQGVEIISTANSRKNILEHKQSNATPLVAPARITFDHDMAVVLGGKEVQAHYVGRGHTNGDAVIVTNSDENANPLCYANHYAAADANADRDGE